MRGAEAADDIHVRHGLPGEPWCVGAARGVPQEAEEVDENYNEFVREKQELKNFKLQRMKQFRDYLGDREDQMSKESNSYSQEAGVQVMMDDQASPSKIVI